MVMDSKATIVTVFSLNNANLSTITSLSYHKPVSDHISVSSYKSVNDLFIKSVHKPFHISSIKPILIVICKCSFHSSSLGARNDCVHVSVNHTICNASVILLPDCFWQSLSP